MKKNAERYYRQGQAYAVAGKQDKALQKFERSLHLARKAEYEKGVAYNLNEMAIIHTQKKEYAEARKKLDQAIAIYINEKMYPELSSCLSNKATTYLTERDAQNALKVYDELLYWSKEAGTKMGEATALAFKGGVYETLLKDRTKAYEAYSMSLKLVMEIGKTQFIKFLQESIDRVKPGAVRKGSSPKRVWKKNKRRRK